MDPTLIKAGGRIAATKVLLDSEAGKKLLGPLAENIGLAIGDLGDIYRHYQNQILCRIFTKWAEARNQKPLAEDEIKKVLPLLRLASEQSDEDLQAKWAALLEHTATSERGVLPSFGQTLSQLTAEEAKFLDGLYEFLSEPLPHRPNSGPDDRRLSRESLLHLYDPSLRGAMSHADIRHFQRFGEITEAQLEARAKVDQAELLLQDLERLGILRHDTNKPDGFVKLPDEINGYPVDSFLAGGKLPVHKRGSVPKPEYSFTPYGLSFVRAITLKRAE